MTGQELFYKTIEDIALEDGTDYLLMIPGVWECIYEHYVNEAIRRLEKDNIALDS